MNTKLSYFFLLLMMSTSLLAQVEQQFSLGLESNSQYYMDDEVTGDFTDEYRFRSNNYLKLDYSINKFSFGMQLESYAPLSLLNYSPNFDDPINIGVFSAAYNTKKFGVTLGHFYEQFGSGLILRSWEDRQLGINNAIRGARIVYKPTDKIDFTTFYGQQRLGFSVSDGQLFGADTNIDLSSETNSLQFGLSYVGRHQDTHIMLSSSSSNDYAFDPITHAVSGRIQYAKNSFFTNIEGVVKSKDVLVEDGTQYNDNAFYGNALQVELGYSKKGFGLTTTLRRMENMNFYSNRLAAGNTYNESIVNYVPGLTKLHDYSLTNIYVYQAQPSLSFNPLKKAGEIGGQIDVYYKFNKGTSLGGKYGTKLAFNYSNWFGLGADYNTEYRRINVGMLDFGEEYFRDINLEVRKKFSKSTSVILAYVNSYYNKTYIEEREGQIQSNIFVADMTYKFSRKQSMRFDVQHLWTSDDKKNWAASTAEFNVNTHLSFFATDMYNYGNDEESHRDHYFNLGGSYTHNKSRFALSYGRTRGGLLCVGGVCREVPAATGVTFNLTTSF